jgi:hypothetical protein
MGTLGRHKRRRRNTCQHECPNTSGGRTTGLEEKGNSLLDASLEPPLSPSAANDEREQHAEPPTTFSSPMKPSTLWPKNTDNTQGTLKSTDPTQKAAASITPLSSTPGKVVADFTTEELSAFLAFLRQDKTTSPSGQGTRHPTPATPSPTTDSTECLLPLHCNNKYIDFEKLSEFNLDFDSFSYKINEFGRKTIRDSSQAIRQAESSAS